ncbi:MAG: EFR1 family ferrodoxin [Spirochaetes bacterium]|nr:EFR1 family ferrodoxin [Spirochaetota bacterium]
MIIHISYFSSTGNTLWSAGKAKEIMEKLGHQVKIFEVIKDGEKFTEDCDLCGFFYPVWESQLPHPFRDLIRKMQYGNGKKFFLVGNCAAASGDTGMVWKKIIEKKGYRVFFADHYYLPYNCCYPGWNYMKAPERGSQKLKKILNKAENRLNQICEAMVKGQKKLAGRGPHSKVLGFLQRLIFEDWDVAGIWKQMLWVDSASCTGCKLCIRMCPTDNMSMDEDGKIKFGKNCILCSKCYNLCPQNAVHMGNKSKDLKKYTRYKGPAKDIKPVLYR